MHALSNPRALQTPLNLTDQSEACHHIESYSRHAEPPVPLKTKSTLNRRVSSAASAHPARRRQCGLEGGRGERDSACVCSTTQTQGRDSPTILILLLPSHVVGSTYCQISVDTLELFDIRFRLSL